MNAADPIESTVAFSAATRAADHPRDSAETAAVHDLPGYSSLEVDDAAVVGGLFDEAHASVPANAAHTIGLG
jgi:hypothetical protein